MKPNIRRLTRSGVQFDDDTQVEDVDVVIYATGYVFGFPFIEEGIIDVVNNKVMNDGH